jgi:hypothetical protein
MSLPEARSSDTLQLSVPCLKTLSCDAGYKWREGGIFSPSGGICKIVIEAQMKGWDRSDRTILINFSEYFGSYHSEYQRPINYSLLNQMTESIHETSWHQINDITILWAHMQTSAHDLESQYYPDFASWTIKYIFFPPSL